MHGGRTAGRSKGGVCGSVVGYLASNPSSYLLRRCSICNNQSDLINTRHQTWWSKTITRNLVNLPSLQVLPVFPDFVRIWNGLELKFPSVPSINSMMTISSHLFLSSTSAFSSQYTMSPDGVLYTESRSTVKWVLLGSWSSNATSSSTGPVTS